MARLQVLRFTKDYQTVADGMATLLKNAVVTEKEEDFGDVKKAVIELEGDFEHFVMEDMDMWGGHFKFEIKDNRIVDADDREARAILSEGMPDFGEVLFSPTIAFVYKRVEYKIFTSTVVERINLDDSGTRVVLSREGTESESQFEWIDITGEFGRKIKVDR